MLRFIGLGLVPLLTFVTGIASYAAEPAPQGVVGNWEINGADSTGTVWTGFLQLIRGSDGLTGHVDWTGAGGKSNGATGREVVSGTFNPRTRLLKLKGESLENASGLVLGTYQAELADDGAKLTNFRWVDDASSGWTAVRSDKAAAPGPVVGAPVWERKVFSDSAKRELPYRLLAPAGFDPKQGKTYPLVVFLHGAGERGMDNERQLSTGLPAYLTSELREKNPCFIFAPQCPGKKPLQYWSETVESGLVSEALESIEKNYPIDANRIYVTGLSDGGWGTYALMARHPEKFAAAVPICGGGTPKAAVKYAKVPIWIFHGLKDDVEPVTSSRNLFVALRKAGGNPMYSEFPNLGHNVWDRAYQNPRVYVWMFSQERK